MQPSESNGIVMPDDAIFLHTQNLIEMEPAQRTVYEGIRLTMHAKVKQAVAARGLARSGIIILDALLKLRQACCDRRLLKLKTVKASSAKSAKLARLLDNCVSTPTKLPHKTKA